MTHRLVRSTLRNWAREVFSVPFFDSINRVIEPPHDSVWATVEFDPSTDQLISFCEDIFASGLADFIFCAPPNVGDDTVLAAGENCVAQLLARSNQGGGAIVLPFARQPEELSGGTADHNYRVVIGVEYRFYYRLPAMVAASAQP